MSRMLFPFRCILVALRLMEPVRTGIPGGRLRAIAAFLLQKAFGEDGEMMRKPTFEAARCRVKRFNLSTLLALTLGAFPTLLVALQCDAQNMSGAQHGSLNSLPQPIDQPVRDPGDVTNGNPNQIQYEKLLRALNADRQKSLVSDANKLLRLANELNAEIGRTNPEELTPSQLHKLAEIEKLAHNVKDKMSASVRGTPAFQPPFQPVHN